MREDIGKSIKRIRKSRDMDQQELAKYVGVNKSSICKIEQGAQLPSLLTTIKIANVLHCSLDDLCGRKFSRNSR